MELEEGTERQGAEESSIKGAFQTLLTQDGAAQNRAASRWVRVWMQQPTATSTEKKPSRVCSRSQQNPIFLQTETE